MNRSGMDRVQQQATRTATPGMSRQSTTSAPLGGRGAQFRAAEMQRPAPTQRGATKADKDDDEDPDKDDDREPLFSRDDDKDDDGADDGNTDPDDDHGDGQTGDNTEDDEDTDPKAKAKKTAA